MKQLFRMQLLSKNFAPLFEPKKLNVNKHCFPAGGPDNGNNNEHQKSVVCLKNANSGLLMEPQLILRIGFVIGVGIAL